MRIARVVALVAALSAASAGRAQDRLQIDLQANNPIASSTSLNVQNDYIGNLSYIDESGNILNLRAI